MTLQSSGAISLLDIAGEFGGSAPHSLNEYYGVDIGVPSSGQISFSDFYGKSVYVPPVETNPVLTVGYYNTGYSQFWDYYGYNSPYGTNPGSLSNTAFYNGGTVAGFFSYKYAYVTNPVLYTRLILSGVITNSGWTSINIVRSSDSSSLTLYRTSATYSSNTTQGQWVWTGSMISTTSGETLTLTYA